MIVNKVLNSFDRYSDSKLSTKIQQIIASMKDNPNFSDLNPAIDVIATAKEKFNDSLIGANSGDRTKIAIKNEGRALLIAAVNYM